SSWTPAFIGRLSGCGTRLTGMFPNSQPDGVTILRCPIRSSPDNTQIRRFTSLKVAIGSIQPTRRRLRNRPGLRHGPQVILSSGGMKEGFSTSQTSVGAPIELLGRPLRALDTASTISYSAREMEPGLALP